MTSELIPYLQLPAKKKKRKRGDRHSDWQANHAVIGGAWLTYFNEHQRAPTMVELARITGFHRSTIKQHVEGLDIERLISTSTTRAMAGKILDRLTSEIMMKPKAPEVKLWFQIHGLKFEDGNSEGGAAQTQTYKAYAGFDIDKV